MNDFRAVKYLGLNFFEPCNSIFCAFFESLVMKLSFAIIKTPQDRTGVVGRLKKQMQTQSHTHTAFLLSQCIAQCI